MGTNIEYKLQVDLISCKYTKLTTDVDIFKNCGLASLESKIVKMHQSNTHTHTHTDTHTHTLQRSLWGNRTCSFCDNHAVVICHSFWPPIV